MTLDDLRAKAEAAKAWRPDVHEAYSTSSEGFRCPIAREGDCDGHEVGKDEYGDAVVEQCSGCRPCNACLGAKRAVEDIADLIDKSLHYAGSQLGNDAASDAARRASYFCSEPNHVSEFRDAVKEMCR